MEHAAPAERDRRYAEFSRYLREEATAEIRQLRHAGVNALQGQGLSLAQIGALLGLNRNRVGAMAAGRSGGGNRPKAQQVHHLDGDPRNNDPANVGLRDEPDAP